MAFSQPNLLWIFCDQLRYQALSCNGDPNIHPEYLALPNVFVLPHLGSATKKTRTAMADLAVNNIKDFFQTGKCKNQVN